MKVFFFSKKGNVLKMNEKFLIKIVVTVFSNWLHCNQNERIIICLTFFIPSIRTSNI